MTIGKLERVQDWVFRQVHTRNLVYNTCWEDPRCDRQLLQLDAASEVVMITSAGCNALDYLLDGPRRIHCVDVNPRQNALLHLKQSALRHASHQDLFALFGLGSHPYAEALYYDQLRADLPQTSRRFWDANLHFFQQNGIRKSFYYYGTSGTFAWLLCRYLHARPSLFRAVACLFNAQNLNEQAKRYHCIERQVLNPALRWLVKRHLTMCLLGVPRSQQALLCEEYPGGTLGFIQDRLRHVFTRIPIRDNYFWRVYLFGAYSSDCCPNYLRPTNHSLLRQLASRIDTHDHTLSAFLQLQPGPYSHYVLLDHQDWLAANHREALHQEWRLILENSRPGTRILLRSAAPTVDFFPKFVRERVQFEQEETQRLQAQDRVGTYGSVYLAIVK